MSRRTINISLLFVAFTFLPISASADIDDAYKVCSALDGTDLLSKPCEVSGWNQAIDVTLDTSSSEARKICAGIAIQASRVGAQLHKDWKIRIYSPYSNGNTIAQCRF